MADEHARAVREAERTAALLKTAFDRLGNKEHPRGRILAAYRQARRAMAGSTDDLRVVNDVLAELRATVAALAQEMLREAAERGERQADAQLALYGLAGMGLGAAYRPDIEQQAWLAQFDAQRAAVLGVSASGGAAAEILGDDNRAGLLTPAPIIRAGAGWVATVTAAALATGVIAGVQRRDGQADFLRQAVAAIDERTTDCCLRVHGQTVGMTEPFSLSGTPRFADRQMSPPFHTWCRSSTALVRREGANDDLSQRMRGAASDELTARAPDDNRRRISPASATSRR